MASGHRGSVVDSLGRLFEAGTVTGLGEAQLLERFLAQGDEAAFEAILQRHGPMVLGVCRRVLDDPHDVADAFQTTFLILVKKARSIRDRDVLGTWLYGVARRVAVRAQVNARRRSHPRADRDGGTGRGTSERSRADRLEARSCASLIDAELERLPARYRQPGDPLRPRGPDARAGRGADRLPGRHGQEPAVAGPRAAPVATGPPRRRALRGPPGRDARRRVRARRARRIDQPDARGRDEARGRQGGRGRGVLGRSRDPHRKECFVPCSSPS